MKTSTKALLWTGGILASVFAPMYLLYRKLKVLLAILLVGLTLYNGITYVAYINNRIIVAADSSDNDVKSAKGALKVIHEMPFIIFNRTSHE